MISDALEACVFILGGADFLTTANLHNFNLKFDAAKLHHIARLDLVPAVSRITVDVTDHNKHTLARRVVHNLKTILSTFDNQHTGTFLHCGLVVSRN